MTRAVRFRPMEGELNEPVSASFRENYRRYSAGIVGSTVTPGACAATLQLCPLEAETNGTRERTALEPQTGPLPGRLSLAVRPPLAERVADSSPRT